MLKFTGVKLILDTAKYPFVESMRRGSISLICIGHPEANNEFLKSYDPSNNN